MPISLSYTQRHRQGPRAKASTQTSPHPSRSFPTIIHIIMLPSSIALRTLLGRSTVAGTDMTALSLLVVARRGACCSGTTTSSSSGISSIARGPTRPILVSLPQQQQQQQQYRQPTQQRAFSSSPAEAVPAKTKKGEHLLSHRRGLSAIRDLILPSSPPPSLPSFLITLFSQTHTAAGKGERTLLTNLRKSGAPTSVLFEALQEKCKVRMEGKEGGREEGGEGEVGYDRGSNAPKEL